MSKIDRRGFFLKVTRGVGAAGVLGGAGFLMTKAVKGHVWQIDPKACTWCNKCKTDCSRQPSAVKCENVYKECGYCDYCYGYYKDGVNDDPDNLICKENAIIRRRVGAVEYEYIIDEDLCNGCGDCVKPCVEQGSGSFKLVVRRDLCLNCNRCSIERVCPSQAIKCYEIYS